VSGAFLGDTAISKLYVGDTAASKLYLGDTLAWSAVVPNILFDAVASTSGTSSPTSLTWTHTPVGVPSIVVVCINAAATSSVVAKVQAVTVTYGGVAMLKAAGASTVTGANLNATVVNGQMFYLLNPPTGARPVVASNLGSLTGGWRMASVTYTGVGSIGSIGGSGATTGTATTTGAIASATGSRLVAMHANNSSSGSFSSPSGTSRFTAPGSITLDPLLVHDMAAGASTTTGTATAPGSTSWVAYGTILIPG